MRPSSGLVGTAGRRVQGPGESLLERAEFAALPGFADDHLLEAWVVFQTFCRAYTNGRVPIRHGVAPSMAFEDVCRRSAGAGVSTAGEAVAFFEANFEPWRILPGSGRGFVTGYYEPEIDGSPVETREFRAPIFARPADLVSFSPSESPLAGLSAGRRMPDGRLLPYPTRAEIEDGALSREAQAIVWLRDPVEAFFVHVQGSARVKLGDGRILRLSYDGRNGRPYTSIGRLLMDEGFIAPTNMSLARLGAWLRADSERGRAMMRRNQSYVFFKAEPSLSSSEGPIGGFGTSLSALRSIAVDRRVWAYGMPLFIVADLPWRTSRPERFARLMVAEDTGSAIRGAARADIFFGTGGAAGDRAGNIRHEADFFVLLPVARGGR